MSNARAITAPAVKCSVMPRPPRAGGYRLRRHVSRAIRGLAVPESEQPRVAALLRRAVVAGRAELEVPHGERRVHRLLDVSRLELSGPVHRVPPDAGQAVR